MKATIPLDEAYKHMGMLSALESRIKGALQEKGKNNEDEDWEEIDEDPIDKYQSRLR